MKDEQNKILDLVAQGKISADEAVILLDKLNELLQESNRLEKKITSKRKITGYDNYGEPIYENDDEMGNSWFTELKDSLQETAKSLAESFEHVDFGFGPAGPKVHFSFESEQVEKILNLEFKAVNGKITMKEHNKDSVLVEGHFRAKSEYAPSVDLCKKDGEYTLKYDPSRMNSMNINIYLPKGLEVSRLYLENRNGPIEIEDFTDINIIEGKIFTTNGGIIVENIRAEELQIETKNSPVKVSDAVIKYLDIVTRNAAIQVEDFRGREVRAVTSNAQIAIDDIDVEELYLRTRNGRVMVEDWEKEEGDTNIYQYTLDAETSNASMHIERPRKGMPYRLQAITSNGRIHGELDDFIYDVDKKTYIDGASQSFDPNKRHVDMKLRTSNGSLHLT